MKDPLKEACVQIVPDTSALDEVKAKIDEINEALKIANSLAKELAVLETLSVKVSIDTDNN